jgi:hypothetical protein
VVGFRILAGSGVPNDPVVAAATGGSLPPSERR